MNGQRQHIWSVTVKLPDQEGKLSSEPSTAPEPDRKGEVRGVTDVADRCGEETESVLHRPPGLPAPSAVPKEGGLGHRTGAGVGITDAKTVTGESRAVVPDEIPGAARWSGQGPSTSQIRGAAVDPEQLTCCHFLKLWPKEECGECTLDQRIRTTSHGQGLQAAPHSVTP